MSFTQAQGQARAIRVLSGLLKTGRLPTALLFNGPDGVGKTMIAHDFAKALVCASATEGRDPCGLCADCQAVDRRLHVDVKAVNQAYQTSFDEGEVSKGNVLKVDTMRHLRSDMELQSLMGGWKVAVIEDAHTLEAAGYNALLKILEEPPAKTLWILVTSQKDRMPKTIPSRCFTVTFAPLPPAVVARALETDGIPAERAARLAELSEGSISRARQLALGPGYPESLVESPLAPLSAPDGLPKEAYLARQQVETALYALAQDLRLKHLDGRAPFSRVERPLRELDRLRRSLRANADPKTVLMLAALEVQGL
jgi:DNA polymerase III delta' subunit